MDHKTDKSTSRHDKKDTDDHTDRNLLTRIAEAIILFVVCCYLVRLGVCYLLAVRIPLIIIAVIVGIAIIIYRTWKWRRDRDDY